MSTLSFSSPGVGVITWHKNVRHHKDNVVQGEVLVLFKDIA